MDRVLVRKFKVIQDGNALKLRGSVDEIEDHGSRNTVVCREIPWNLVDGWMIKITAPRRIQGVSRVRYTSHRDQIRSQKPELFVKWSIDRGLKRISLKDDRNYIEYGDGVSWSRAEFKDSTILEKE
jgi:hypothetical protein